MEIHLNQFEIDVLGTERCQIILDTLQDLAWRELQQSYTAAVTGALRWHPNLRPEVLVGAKVRML